MCNMYTIAPGSATRLIAMETNATNYAAITCDIVGSRQIEEFRRKRDQKLRRISKLHVERKWILSEYAITAWDEFEGILSRPTNVPAVIVDLRRHFHPFELWIGIGIGEVTEPHKKPVNVFAGGEAFERAREAMNKLKPKRSKTGVLTSFVTGNKMFDLIGDTVYQLHDSLLQSISNKQWETINVLMETSGQELAAKKLGLNKSTISRNLRRGFWWQIQETQVAMERIIGAYFPIAR
jgi:SatD family (SatD)